MALAKEGAATIAIADGRPWHAGGASDEQELGIVLASFVHHLRLLGDRIDVTLVADADQFRTIAKFRAMRLLLARLGEVAGIGIAARIHAETAWRSLSLGEPHMNILRAASAAFGAANGGADSITVLSFDALTGGGPHGRRLARNTQTILAPEAQLFRVADPAAGSGAIEAMTAALAERAWGQFQRIEAAGGIVRAIQDRGIFQEIASERDRRRVQGPPPTGDLSRLVYRRLAEAEET
jgi:methylmalonyl-CoA mutase